MPDLVHCRLSLRLYNTIQTTIIMLSEEARKSLATKMNDMIDVPMLSESQEQCVAEKIIDACLGQIKQQEGAAAAAAPTQEQLVEANGNPEKQNSLKASMVSKLNGMVDIPFANEEQEAMVLNMIVDCVMKDKMTKAVEQQESDS